MAYPNALIFVDLASDDPQAAGDFYAKVFGWKHEPRVPGVFHRMVPGDKFLNPDGSPSEIGNLHIGIFNAKNARPFPAPAGADPRGLSRDGRKARIWISVSADDSVERILTAAEQLGARILWRDHYWKEFNGFNHAFRDPWGNEIVLWKYGSKGQVIPEGYTSE
jgi:predicted enzyme related to lactoylglutathione lyase